MRDVKNEALNSNYKWLERIPSLRRWRIASFKSVKNLVDVDLAPLTIVVGANSSGKSTLIQSILLTAQNSLKIDEKSSVKMRGNFELNGPLVQLGTFRETACDLVSTKYPSLDLGGVWFAGDKIVRSNEAGEVTGQGITRLGEQFLNWDLELRPNNRNADSGVVLVHSSLAQSFIKSEITERAESTRTIPKAGIDLLKSKFERFSFDHIASLEDYRNMKDNNRPFKSRSNAVSFRVGLPISGLVHKKIVDYMFDNQEQVLMRAFTLGEGLGGPDDVVNSDVKKFTSIEKLIDAYVLKFAEFGRKILQQDRTAEDRNVFSLSRYIEESPFIDFEQFPESVQSYFGYSLEDDDFISGEKYVRKFIKDLRKSLDEIYGDSEWVRESTFCLPNGKRSTNPNIRGNESYLSRLIQYWNRYLSENVLYLGPLRVGPRASYGIGSSIENYNLPLGESGEFFAKKLFNDRTPKFYPIVERGQLRDARLTLEQAVSFWYQELCATGEQNEIGVDAPNRQGYPLKIGRRTLADVGFGASQILPVLGICLSASPGDLILLEQPELHLNPGMQQKLADFLLLMSKTGRQIIVETHSEYLITRLRRNAASEPDDHKYFTIIFVERDEKEGTSYRTVNVNEMGDLSEWPKGFFDHVAEDLRVLMRKAAERQGKPKN
jgi:predicted ATPase